MNPASNAGYYYTKRWDSQRNPISFFLGICHSISTQANPAGSRPPYTLVIVQATTAVMDVGRNIGCRSFGVDRIGVGTTLITVYVRLRRLIRRNSARRCIGTSIEPLTGIMDVNISAIIPTNARIGTSARITIPSA